MGMYCPGDGRGAAAWSLWAVAGAAPWGTPADPPQGTTEPLSQDDGTWGNMCLRVGKNAREQREVRKNSEKHPCMLQGERRRRGRRHSRHGSRDFPSAHGEDHVEQVLLKDCSPWAIHKGAGEQREEEGAAETRCYGLTTTPAALRAGEAEELGMEEGNWGWEKGEVLFLFLSFQLFQLAIN